MCFGTVEQHDMYQCRAEVSAVPLETLKNHIAEGQGAARRSVTEYWVSNCGELRLGMERCSRLNRDRKYGSCSCDCIQRRETPRIYIC